MGSTLSKVTGRGDIRVSPGLPRAYPSPCGSGCVPLRPLLFWKTQKRSTHCVVMESGSDNSSVSDGSGAGRETRRTKETDGRQERGPKFKCTKSAFMEWCWESEPVWDAMGLHKTYTGENRGDQKSANEKRREKYERRNAKLFRVIIRQLDRDSIAGRKMRMMIMDG